MKKLVLGFCFSFLSFFHFVQAQDSILVATPTSHQVDLLLEEEIFNDYFYIHDFLGFITNLSSDTLQIRWRREEISAPEEWDNFIADMNLTYTPFVDSNYDLEMGINFPLQLLPQEESVLNFYLFTHSTSGCGHYNIHFSTFEEPDSILLTLPIDICNNLATTTLDLKKNSIQLFPNPTSSTFSFSSKINNTVFLKDATGKVISAFPPQHQYSVQDISPGYYWVHLIETEEVVVFPLIITK